MTTTNEPVAKACDGGVHAWPNDWTNGDTCDCGRFYLFTDGAAFSIQQTETARTTPLHVGSIFGAHSQRGLVELTVGIERVQMEVGKAREIAHWMTEAIEAAIGDELLVKFLTSKIGLPPEAAMRALLDFRELRQGSRESVNPN